MKTVSCGWNGANRRSILPPMPRGDANTALRLPRQPISPGFQEFYHGAVKVVMWHKMATRRLRADFVRVGFHQKETVVLANR
ncbi:MAG: hypothetical protein ABSG78_03700 [Verrucomicrobiota bacterium]|jgi:hypothetical protein